MTGERVFISYARADHEDEGRAPGCFVQKLYRALQAEGFVPWLDHHDLPSRGAPFPAELAKAVEQSQRFIAVCGPNYPSSDWARAERGHALLHCLAITPVLFEGDHKTSLPAEIATLNAVDMRRDFEACWPDLLKRLRQEAAMPGPLRGDPIPLPPPNPLPRTELIERIRTTMRPEDSLPVVLSGRQGVSALHAPFGLGKTTLAAMTALDCAVRRGFPDGVVWISVGKEATADGLRSKIGAAFGLSAEQMREAAALTALLQGKDALLIFDDVWDYRVVEGCLVPAPRVRYLITTRQPRIAAHLKLPQDNRIELDYLSPEKGAELIARRLGLDPAADYPHKQTHLEIARLLGGHMQAIALAAAQLDPAKHGPDFAPQLLERLREAKAEQPFKDLQIGEEREENLEASLSLSYGALSEDLQRRFRLLGAFSAEGTFDEAAAAAVWEDADPDEAHDALTALYGEGLVGRAGEGRYRLHGILHTYALALLERAEEHAAARERHFAHYERLHGDHNANNDEDRHPRISEDFENVRHALNWGFEHEPRRACDVATALAYYMSLRHPFTTQEEVLEAAHRAAVRMGYGLGEANTLKALGDVARMRNAYDAAEAFYNRALPLYEQIGDRLGQSGLLMSLGDMLVGQQKWAEAIPYYEKALVMARAISARLSVANILVNLGRARFELGDTESGVRDMREAAVLFAAVQNPRWSLIAYSRLADMLDRMGRHDEAEQVRKEHLS